MKSDVNNMRRLLVKDEHAASRLAKSFYKKNESKKFQPYEVYKDYQSGKPYGPPYEFKQKQVKKITRSDLA